MGFLGFHHFGTFLLLIAFGLLVASTVTSPVVHRLALLNVSSSSLGDLTFGVFGYCTVINNADDTCTSVGIGYSLSDALDIVFGSTTYSFNISTSVDTATKALLLHPISAGVTGLAFLIAACSSRFGYFFAAIVAGLAWILTVCTLVVDLVIFLAARREVIKAGASASLGVGLWLTVGACAVLFIGAIATLFSCVTDRRQRKTSSGNVGGSYIPVIGTRQAHV